MIDPGKSHYWLFPRRLPAGWQWSRDDSRLPFWIAALRVSAWVAAAFCLWVIS